MKRAEGSSQSNKIPLRHSPVKLNVGGVRYWTTYDTLTSRGPNFFTAMLDHEASGKLSSQKDEKGFFFIDRNGEIFRVVLEFLRTGEEFLPVGVTQRQIDIEFEFYQISRQSQPVDDLEATDAISIGDVVECKVDPTLAMVRNLFRQCKVTAWKWLKENEKFICMTIQKDSKVGNFSTHKFWFVDEPGPNWSCYQNPESTYDSGFLSPLNQCDECFLSALSSVTYEKWGIYCIPQAERRTYKSSELQRNWSGSWISIYFTWKQLVVDPNLVTDPNLTSPVFVKPHKKAISK